MLRYSVSTHICIFSVASKKKLCSLTVKLSGKTNSINIYVYEGVQQKNRITENKIQK